MTTVCACVNDIVLALVCYLEAKQGDCASDSITLCLTHLRQVLLVNLDLDWHPANPQRSSFLHPLWCWGYKDRQLHLALHMGFKSDPHTCTLSLSFNSFSSSTSSSFLLANCKMRSLEILMPTKPFIVLWCQKERGLFSGTYIFIESWLLSSSIHT